MNFGSVRLASAHYTHFSYFNNCDISTCPFLEILKLSIILVIYTYHDLIETFVETLYYLFPHLILFNFYVFQSLRDLLPKKDNMEDNI